MLSQRRNERRRLAWRMTGIGLAAVLWLLPVAAWTAADSIATAPPAGSTPATPSSAASTPTTATAAAVGLLPIHGIAVDFDALPSAGKGKKDESLKDLQKLWDSYLKKAGFNVIYFGVDVRDLGDGGAGRVARLCEWAKANNVRIAPNLVGAPEGQPLPVDYPSLAAAFVGKVMASLGAANVPSYSQIMFYQLGRPLNHPASHGAMDASAAAAAIKSAAESIRAAEQAGLAQSGMQASPLLVSASFDYELIRRGAIASTAISDESYGQAYDGLEDYLAAVLGAAPVEAVSVEWFPGSLSSEAVDRLPDLVTRLQGDLPGKLLVMDTGYSSAGAADSAQARYYAVALNNLCDLRASQGVDSPFAGILWRSAVDLRGPEDAAAAAGAQNPGDRAAALNRFWNDPKADAKEARSWLSSVQSHFGLLARSGKKGGDLAPKTAHRLMSSLETALAQSPAAADAIEAVKEIAAGGNGGVGSTIKSKLQTAMFGMLDAWLNQQAQSLFSTGPEESMPAPSGPAMPQPDLQVVGIGDIPNGLTVGSTTRIPVTLFNAGNAPALDASVYLRDQANKDLARTNPTAVSAGGTTTVELQWTPDHPGTVPGVGLEVFCANDADPSTNSALLGDFSVTSGGGPRPPRPFNQDIVIHGTAVLTADRGGSSSGGGSTGGTATGGATAGGSMSSGGTTSGGGGTPGRTTVMMATSTQSGFASIEGINYSTMSAPAPSSSSSAPAGAGTPRSIVPATTPVSMTVVNPFKTAFRNTVATLKIENRVIASREIGTLLPGQRRTVTFTEWRTPKPGTYDVHVDLVGEGLLRQKMTSTATSQIVIPSQGGTVRMAAAPEPAAAPAPKPMSRPVAPLVRPASSSVMAWGGRPLMGLSSGGVRALGGGPVLGLSANSIVLQPFPALPGAPVSVTVRLSNMDRTAANAARVQVSVDGEALGEVTVDVPAAGAAVASGFKAWIARNGRHDFRATVVLGDRRSEAVKPVLVNAAGTRGIAAGRGLGGMALGVGTAEAAPAPGDGKTSTGMPGATGTSGGMTSPVLQPGLKPMGVLGRSANAPDLQIAAADIRFTPAAPTAASAVNVTITVRNLGGSIASDGKVLAILTADGREVARQQFNALVPPRGLIALQWPLTAPAGQLVVTATATATRDANPNNNHAKGSPSAATPARVAPSRLPTMGTR